MAYSLRSRRRSPCRRAQRAPAPAACPRVLYAVSGELLGGEAAEAVPAVGPPPIIAAHAGSPAGARALTRVELVRQPPPRGGRGACCSSTRSILAGGADWPDCACDRAWTSSPGRGSRRRIVTRGGGIRCLPSRPARGDGGRGASATHRSTRGEGLVREAGARPVLAVARRRGARTSFIPPSPSSRPASAGRAPSSTWIPPGRRGVAAHAATRSTWTSRSRSERPCASSILSRQLRIGPRGKAARSPGPPPSRRRGGRAVVVDHFPRGSCNPVFRAPEAARVYYWLPPPAPPGLWGARLRPGPIAWGPRLARSPSA